MSTQTSGALAAGAPAAIAGTPAPGAPAAPPAAAAGAAPAAPAPASAPAANAPAAEGAFVMPKDLTDWGANKGYNAEAMTKYATESPEIYKMMTSYREAERALHAATGADKIIVPKDLTNFKDVAPLLDRLGAPAKGADYKLDVPQGADNQFAITAGDKFAELKLLPEQAAGLNKWWNEYGKSIQTAQAEKTANEGRESIAKLEAEWAGDTTHNSKIAALGFNKMAQDLGMDANRQAEIKNGNNVTLSAYEFAKLSKAYADLAKVGGDSFEGGGEGQGGGVGQSTVTPEGAKAEINRLLADPTFAKKYMAKDEESVKKMNDLYKTAASGGITSTR